MSSTSRVVPPTFLEPADFDDPASPRAATLTLTKPPSEADKTRTRAAPASDRCSVAGCVFPAWEPATGRCHYHVAFDEEAEFFQSCQPTLHVIAQYLLGVPEPEIEEYLRQQKRMRAIVRGLFLQGVA